MAIDYRLDCVFYYTSDMDRAIDFYAEVLGLELDSRDEVARFRVGGLCLELVPATDPAQVGGQGNARVCLTVRDLRRTMAELAAMGVPVTAVRAVTEGLLATFRDPDGNELELWQRTRPRQASAYWARKARKPSMKSFLTSGPLPWNRGCGVFSVFRVGGLYGFCASILSRPITESPFLSAALPSASKQSISLPRRG